MESSAAIRPSAVAFSTSFLVMVERTQLVEEDLAIALLVARCFTRIQHKSALGGFAREEEAEEISNGGGGGHELVNSTIPHYASYISSGRRIVG
jgi:dihydroxyacetone kinase